MQSSSLTLFNVGEIQEGKLVILFIGAKGCGASSQIHLHKITIIFSVQGAGPVSPPQSLVKMNHSHLVEKKMEQNRFSLLVCHLIEAAAAPQLSEFILFICKKTFIGSDSLILEGKKQIAEPL